MRMWRLELILMAEQNKMNSNDGEESKNNELSQNSSQEKQTVFKVLGIEVTAPSTLKNPGIVYISFIVINIILFLLFRKLVAG